jgi:hypothetical protein
MAGHLTLLDRHRTYLIIARFSVAYDACIAFQLSLAKALKHKEIVGA